MLLRHSRARKAFAVGASSLCMIASNGAALAEEQGLQQRGFNSPITQLLQNTEGFSHKSLLDAIGKFGKKDSGSLAMFDSRHKSVGDCVLNHTNVVANISGYMARVTVTQKFHNSYKEKVEAVYTFPLPDQAAVDDMTMKIGNRVIKGDIHEREKARQIYDQAAAQGYTAALLDQERPNIFTQSVANVEPGADVDVVISYTQILPYENGQYAFVFPTVVGERFIPGSATSDLLQGERKKGSPLVPDAHLLTPPVKSRSGHDISMTVTIDGGVPIRNVQSPLHEVQTQWANNSSTVSLVQKNEIPNRDFILTWDASASSLESGYLAHKDGAEGFVTVMMMPPKQVTRSQIAPREMIFVVDCSGSMYGQPIEKCKETMHYVLDKMNENDSFQIIAFNSACAQLFPQPRAANAQTKRDAHQFIKSLEAAGGTFVGPAIEKACAIPADKNRLRIVTMMTDGDVGNEYEAAELVKRLRNKSRWFPFGIGNGTNQLILNKLAEEGGGEAELVTLNTPSKKVVEDFYSKISSPVLTDVKLSVDSGILEDVYPRQLSDVWAQKPLYFKARYHQSGTAKVTLSGYQEGKPYVQTMNIVLPDHETRNGSIAQIWARAKVDELMSMDYMGVQTGNLRPSLKKEIVETAVAHHIMTQYTSFVAVDSSHKTVAAPVKRVDVPVEPVQGTYTTADHYSSGGGSCCDAFNSTADSGNQTGNFTGSQTMQGGSSNAPALQGATTGTIGPQGQDATVIQGTNTAGTVRVNNLANLEALLNILANGFEILGVGFGLLCMIMAFLCKTPAKTDETGENGDAVANENASIKRERFIFGALIATLGLATPSIINWMVSFARDANLFS